MVPTTTAYSDLVVVMNRRLRRDPPKVRLRYGLWNLDLAQQDAVRRIAMHTVLGDVAFYVDAEAVGQAGLHIGEYAAVADAPAVRRHVIGVDMVRAMRSKIL